MIIKPEKSVGSHKTGSISQTSVSEINKILGFKPNVKDDPYKVKNSWAFSVNGVKCAIWDWKGSERDGQFSTFGPDEIFFSLFGERYMKGMF